MGLEDKIQMAGISDTGQVRTQNEDRLLFDRKLGLAVVADGVGGHAAGEVASSLAVTVIQEQMSGQLGPGGKGSSGRIPPEQLVAWVEETLQKAHGTIKKVADSQPQYTGMGSALVMALFHDNQLLAAHVGDCRLYRFRKGELEQLTQDHTVYQDLINRGTPPEEARKLVNPNVISQALGGVDEIVPATAFHPVKLDDVYLLCSDGLTDMVDDRAIRDILRLNDDLDAAARDLIQRANDNGGKDNVTVLLARPVANFPAHKGWLNRLFR